MQSPILTLNTELDPDLTTTPDEFLCAPPPHEEITNINASIAQAVRFKLIKFMIVL